MEIKNYANENLSEKYYIKFGSKKNNYYREQNKSSFSRALNPIY
jgi:hypothetical protein